MMLIEIAVEHKITYIEQIKSKFFELFEKLEDRMALESKNNEAIKFNLILENQIRINRQTLHSQDVVGPMLKNLFEKGITENEIVAVKALIDTYSYNSSSTGVRGREEGNNIAKTNIQHENLNLSSNNNNNNNNSNYNWKKECEKSYLY